MAFTLNAIVGSTTTSLTDGNPFWLASAEGLSGAPIMRHEQRGPLQSGATDLGYRLQPRVMTLNVHFYAGTDATLDTYRSTLMAAFKPLSDIAIRLEATRDDGTVRYLTCHTIDEIKIDLLPEHRPGHLHRAVIVLRAASPPWVSATLQSTAGTIGNSEWWLAGGTISSGLVLEHVENPAIGQAWTWVGSDTTAWAVAIRTVINSPGAGTQTMWQSGSVLAPRFFWDGDNYAIGTATAGGETPPSGTVNFFYTHDVSGTASQFHAGFFNDRTDTSYIVTLPDGYRTIAGSTGYWGSAPSGGTAVQWPNPILRAAVYSTSLFANSTRLALNATMGNTQIPASFNVVNAGDLPDYPLITLTGPMSNPVIINQTTASTITLTGLTIGTGISYQLDLRTGNKTLTDNLGNNVLGSVTTLPIDMASWHLAPAPTATGGTNSITVYADTAGDPVFTFTHTNRYLSF